MEKRIIKDLRKGSISAFDAVFNAYYQILCLYSFQFVKSEETAKDLVQEVFLNLWENHSKINPDLSLKSFLYVGVKNKSFDYLKHKKIRDTYLKEDHLPQDNTLSETQMVKLERIHRAIESLPPKCAEIFRLSRFEQLKYAEIAEKLNISIKTVENQMGKALKSIREQM